LQELIEMFLTGQKSGHVLSRPRRHSTLVLSRSTAFLCVMRILFVFSVAALRCRIYLFSNVLSTVEIMQSQVRYHRLSCSTVG
jgi:hypothetical protein